MSANFIRCTFPLIVFLLFGFLRPTAASGQSLAQLKGEIDQLLKTYNVPGASVAVVKGNEIIFAEGFGRVQDGSVKIDTSTLFQAASISKPVTAFATLRMVDDGKLKLDVPVQNYVTSYNLGGARVVTLRQILSHTAGLSVHGFGGYQVGQRLPTLTQILGGKAPANSGAIVVERRPGQSFKYSGGGYCVLQQALIDATGKKFPEAMDEFVLGPVGMKNSTFQQPISKEDARKAATAHDTRGRPVNGRWNTYPEMAAAGLWTSPSDLARFIIAVQTAYVGGEGALLSQDLTKEMLTPQVSGGPGLGLFVSGDDENGTFSHSGVNHGFRCLLRGTKKPGTGIVIMSNSDQGERLYNPIERLVNSALSQEE